MTSSYPWSWFQSVAQISVALNATFATIATFLGGDIAREERQIRLEINKFRKALPSSNLTHNTIADVTKLRLLNGKLVGIRKNYEAAIDIVFRPFCIIGFVIGFASLISSSIKYEEKMSYSELLITLGSSLPFLLGFLYSLIISAYVYFFIVRCRKKIVG